MIGEMMRNGNRNAHGSALIVAMALILLLASTCVVLVSEMSMRAKRVEVDLEDIKAFEAAEAGLDAAIHDINSSPVYQPDMSPPALTYPSGIIGPGATASRVSSGELQSNGQLMTTTGIPLIGPDSNKPLTVHVAKRADGARPGCLGTSNWSKSLNDLDGNGRPTWRPTQLRNQYGQALSYSNGRARFCEDAITPQALGNVAFFTYAIDWFHDGVDNDGDGTIDDRNERNKYTIYSTGIHRGLQQSGVTEAGRVVTLEIMVQALDKDFEQFPRGALEFQIRPRN